ncbi:hypothetical protein MMC32_001234 [Xylographa parallela]|nr:hypothetical protein [Xylographa parallela]
MKTTACIVPLLAVLPNAYAWGELGHMAIAYVAQNFLTAKTVTYCQKILNDTSTSYLASVAPWADSYRETTAGAFSEPFHFIDALDNPPTTCDVEYSRDCGTAGCVVSAINNYTARVQNTKLSSTDINQALMFIVHFVGDIHQPLHDENYDLGGNEVSVTFAGTTTNLHAVWDTSIPQKYAGSATLAHAKTWATTLTADIKTGAYKNLTSGWLEGINLNDPVTTATGWASEANAIVCTTVVPNGWSAVAGKDLSTTYYTSVLPTIQLQHATAGYRLAAWLNLIATGSTGLQSRSMQEEHDEFATPEILLREYKASKRLFARGKEAFCKREL